MYLDSSCVFCQILGQPDRHVYRTAQAVAFAPLSPVTQGHMLVIPTHHVTSALADPITAMIVMHEAVTYARSWGVESANFITSAGRDATQTVFHYHVHVVPRRAGDGLRLPWTDQPEATEYRR